MSLTRVPTSASRRRPADPLRDAAHRLRGALPAGEDATVLVDFLEDDLREGLAALAELEGHFTGLLDALGAPRLSPISLLEAADDARALEQVETLAATLAQLRRRIAAAAGRLRARDVTT